MRKFNLNKRKLPVLLLATAVAFLTGCQSSSKAVTSEKALPLKKELGPEYTIIYGAVESGKKSLFLTDDEGRSRLKVTDATLSDGYPAVSPDGRQIAFYGKYDDYKTWSIHTVNMDGTQVRRLTQVQQVWDSAPTWSPDGKTIAFAREYKDANEQWREEIWLMNADGSNKRQIKGLDGRAPFFMPDGRILFHSKSPNANIFIGNIDGTGLIQLTNTEGNDYSPKLSPDGKQVAFLGNRDGNQEVYVMNIDGTQQTRLTRNRTEEWDPFWSLDGTKIYFSSESTYGGLDIYSVNKDGSGLRKIIQGGSQGASFSGAKGQ